MSETNPAAAATPAEAAPHRYTAVMAAEVEARWQDFWDAAGTYAAPNPKGDLGGDPRGENGLEHPDQPAPLEAQQTENAAADGIVRWGQRLVSSPPGRRLRLASYLTEPRHLSPGSPMKQRLSRSLNVRGC